jgi:anti-sigma B factor antagonist
MLLAKRVAPRLECKEPNRRPQFSGPIKNPVSDGWAVRQGGGEVQTLAMSTGNPVVAMSGQIDLANAEAIGAALEPWLRAGGPLTLDLSGVTFMDSAGIHLVITAAKRLAGRGCVIIHGAHGPVWRLLQLTKLEQALENVHFIECTVLVEAA